MQLRVSILGSGSFGSTVAHLAARNAPTVLWARNAEAAEEVNRDHTNERYLKGYHISPKVRGTASLEEAVREADIVVMGVPSLGMRKTLDLYNTGARVQEIVDLNVEDLHDADAGLAFVRLRGKGRKQRTCPLWPRTVAAARTGATPLSRFAQEVGSVGPSYPRTRVSRWGGGAGSWIPAFAGMTIPSSPDFMGKARLSRAMQRLLGG